ncbi:MAG: hypothetical protein RLZZ591_2635 [Pseudomonadota bacterium]|jgi:hypothetical protein
MPTHAPEASADYITLHGTHTSVVLEVRPHEAPLWRYWGSLRNQKFTFCYKYKFITT